MTSPRRVISIQPGQPASDGAGVRLNRVIGGPGLERFDPFLMPVSYTHLTLPTILLV